MTEAAKDQDQSMEEILQSIKRIIAEEGDSAPPAGSDVLELTDMVADDGAILKVDSETSTLATMSIDEIMAAPLASGPAPIEFTPTPVAAPAPAPEPEIITADDFPAAPAPAMVEEAAPVAAPIVAAPAPATPAAPAAAGLDHEALISETTLQAASSAMQALKNIPESPLPAINLSGVGFRSGSTIEDLVLEGLRPMLREWLDANLTSIVERLVEKEVRKLSQR